MKRLLLFLPGMLALLLSGCGPAQGSSAAARDTATQGDVRVVVDATLRPLFHAEVKSFLDQNEKAKVQADFFAEAQCIREFIDQKCRVMVVTRKLNEDENASFEAKGLKIRYTLVARDGITLITSKSNPLTQLSRAELQGIFSGTISRWSQLSEEAGNGMRDSLVLVSDTSGSSLVRILAETFKLDANKGIRVFGAGSGEKVIEYVKQNPSALGIIGLNYLSDMDDSLSLKFRQDLNILALEAPEDAPEREYYHRPWAGSLKDGNYPLKREVYMATWEPYIGLGTGFVHFVAGEKGQRIVAKAGMAPGTQPYRLIQLPPIDNATDIHEYIKEERKKKNE